MDQRLGHGLIGTTAILFTGAVWFGIFVLAWEGQRQTLTSCRNHSSFVRNGLEQYVENHGRFPHDPELASDLLLCQLDFHGHYGAFNCNEGAPGQALGGWQMVNAPTPVWNALIAEFGEDSVPIFWCGRAHPSGGRIVGFIGYTAGSVAGWVAGEPFIELSRLSESELQTTLDRVDAVLQRHGHPRVNREIPPDDVQPPRDYEELAQPYQTPWPAPEIDQDEHAVPHANDGR